MKFETGTYVMGSSGWQKTSDFADFKYPGKTMMPAASQKPTPALDLPAHVLQQLDTFHDPHFPNTPFLTLKLMIDNDMCIHREDEDLEDQMDFAAVR